MPLPSGSPPSPHQNDVSPDDWTPYNSQAQFELAKLLYTKAPMSAGNINQLMKTGAAHGAKHGDEPPFLDHKDLYKTIDTTTTSHVPWQSFVTSYDGKIPWQGKVLSWMTAEHTVWFRNPHLLVHNILSNPNFKDMFVTPPYQEYDTNHNHRYHNFMSGNWAAYVVSFMIIMPVLISRLIGICRTSSLKILQHTGLCCAYHPWQW